MNQEHALPNIDNSADVLSASQQNWVKTIGDLRDGFLAWRVWLLIAWQDIRLRYRRSHLGPFWLTISMAVHIYSIGFFYGKLFHANLQAYYPHLAGGILAWSMISSLINEGTGGFVSSENYLKQMHIPYTVFTIRVIARNIMVFMHNVVVILPIIFIFHLNFSWHILLIIPSLAILIVNAFGFGLLFAMVGARYRDIQQVIQSLIQIAFFLTPIMWMPDHLPERYRYTIDYNPFAQFVDIVRAPLIGQVPSLHNYYFTITLGIVGLVLAVLVFNRSRKRIIYWL